MADFVNFVSNHSFLWITLLFIVVLIISEEISSFSRNLKIIDTTKAIQMINQGNLSIVDLRSASEFEKGTIDRGAIYIDQTNYEKEIKNLKDQILIVYDNEKRLNEFCKKAKDKTLFTLSNGINSWLKEDLPLVKSLKKGK